MPATLTIVDNRTGANYEVPIEDGAVRATAFRQLHATPDDRGLLVYDPAFMNTAACRSAITFSDGETGELRYRGYPIGALAARSPYLETAYLLVHGDLPTPTALARWHSALAAHDRLPPAIDALIAAHPADASPIRVYMAAMGALGAHASRPAHRPDRAADLDAVVRVLGLAPHIATRIAQHLGPTHAPGADTGTTCGWTDGLPHALLGRASDTPWPAPLRQAWNALLVLHADHQQNLSTTTMRMIGSARVAPEFALVGAAAALAGPRHGGAVEAVHRMLTRIGTTEHVPAFLAEVRAPGSGLRLPGFGSRVYKTDDPRAVIIRELCEQVHPIAGRGPLVEVAQALELAARADTYFASRRLFPNVDFYAAQMFDALGFTAQVFPLVFAMARTAGWLAQWFEGRHDAEQKILYPRQRYDGPPARDYVPVPARRT